MRTITVKPESLFRRFIGKINGKCRATDQNGSPQEEKPPKSIAPETSNTQTQQIPPPLEANSTPSGKHQNGPAHHHLHPPPHDHHPHDDHDHHHPPSPAGHHGTHRHRVEPGFHFTLKEMVREGNLRSIDDLIAFAGDHGENEIRRILQAIANADPEQPLDLVLNELRLIAAKNAAKASQKRHQELGNSKIGMFLPLPPHVLDEFIAFPNRKFLNPGGHPLLPHLRKLSSLQISSSRECRDHARELDCVILEGFRHNGTLYIRESVADVIDFVSNLKTIKFYVHHAPHKHPGAVSTKLSNYEEV